MLSKLPQGVCWRGGNRLAKKGAYVSNSTGRFAVYLSVEHVKINVHQQAVQVKPMECGLKR